jgi:carnitine 3-dehydrogenase
METLLLHTDLALRRVCPSEPHVAEALARWVAAHASLDRPEGAGRAVGGKKG